jgi:hypothetical protein
MTERPSISWRSGVRFDVCPAFRPPLRKRGRRGIYADKTPKACHSIGRPGRAALSFLRRQTSHNAIAGKLNERGVKTARGGKWTHVQVGAALART